MKIEVDLDKIMTGAPYEGSVGEILRDELRLLIKSEIRKSLKDDRDLKRLISEMRKRAIAAAIVELEK